MRDTSSSRAIWDECRYPFWSEWSHRCLFAVLRCGRGGVPRISRLRTVVEEYAALRRTCARNEASSRRASKSSSARVTRAILFSAELFFRHSEQSRALISGWSFLRGQRMQRPAVISRARDRCLASFCLMGSVYGIPQQYRSRLRGVNHRMWQIGKISSCFRWASGRPTLHRVGERRDGAWFDCARHCVLDPPTAV